MRRAVGCACALAWASSAWAAGQNLPSTGVAANGSSRCTYTTSQWDVVKHASSHAQVVDKPYAEVADNERDPSEPRCSVCREDQEAIDARSLGVNVPAFLVCHVYAADVRAALRAVVADKSSVIKSITGYRVGRTRGAIVDGLRTEWSNHSFGAALDINAGHNGLYSDCSVANVSRETLVGCKLRVGGAWDPNKRPDTTITTTSSVYRALRKFWRWGGEITGGTRDMMHFSPTGY